MKKRLDLASVRRLALYDQCHSLTRDSPQVRSNLVSSDVSDSTSSKRDTAEEQRPGGACTSGGGLPMIAMMQAADAGHSHDLGGPAGPAFDSTERGRLLLQGIVNAIVVVIVEVISNPPPPMGFVQDDHVVQEVPATAPHPALRHALLPGTAISGSDQLTAKVWQHPRDLSAELAVAVQDQILGGTILWEGLSQLLHDPGTAGMLGDVEVQDFATAVADHQEAVKHPEGRVGHSEKS